MLSSRQMDILPVTRALWKLERSLAWYGLSALRIGPVQLTPEGEIRAEVGGADDSPAATATLDRRTGRLSLDRR